MKKRDKNNQFFIIDEENHVDMVVDLAPKKKSLWARLIIFLFGESSKREDWWQ